MSHYRLSRGTKEDPAQARPPVRRNHNQIDVALFRDANNLRRGFTVNDEFLNFDSRALVTLRELRQFAFG
jgi:hypothetical protein